MAGTALRRRLTWRPASLVDSRVETERVRSLTFDVAGWEGHLPGQHVDLRVTAEDGYQAQRSYSIASAPQGARLELTVERLPDGEVSPYLVDVLEPGDQVEVRGPIGGWFVWDGSSSAPLLLVAGGSGVVPLMSILRHRAALAIRVPTRLLYSSHDLDQVIYREELERLAADGWGPEVLHVLTRRQPRGWRGYARRIDRAMLAEVAWSPADSPEAFVCGPTPLVEAVATSLLELGHASERIKTERFGPTGG
ncbi:MAG: ferredoxin reductase [Nitriliruptorales bacterium]